MKYLLLPIIALFLSACSTYERPSERIRPIPEPEVKNAVDSISQAAEVLVRDLVARSKITQRIRIGFLPVQNRFLDEGVSLSLSNSLLDELISKDKFDVLKDIDLKTIRQAMAIEHSAQGFLDEKTKISLGKRIGADAIVTCTVSDAIQYWQIHVDLTPVSSNVVATSATCNLPKRVAIRSQIY